MGGPEGQRRRAGGRKQKQENRGPEGGPGPQGSSGLVPRWGEGGGRDGSVGRPDGRRAPSVGLTNGAVGAVGVGCTVAWAAKMHALSLVLRGFGYEIAPAARCFCFLNRGPGPSDGAGGGALTERSKNLRPAVAAAAATAAAKTGTEAVEAGGCARGGKQKVGGGMRRRRSERGGRRRRQGITERAESDAAERDEGEQTCHHIATTTEHLTFSSANP